MEVNGVPRLPQPSHAHYPAGGSDVVSVTVGEDFRITAHPGGIFRVWRVARTIGDWAYYDVEAVGMTDEEIERAVGLACKLLSMPSNRATRRAGLH